MKEILEGYLKTVESALEVKLPASDPTDPGKLCEAMRYSVLGGGKRLRPLLVLASCEAGGGKAEEGVDGACAVEMIHAYSLVHDDLPSMDDDDERRGRPSCHKTFSEATAVLAGDALLTLAFDVLSSPTGEKEKDVRRLRAVSELAKAAGWEGLVGGQSLDIAYEKQVIEDMALLERIHKGKTGALFRASCVVGGLLGGCVGEELKKLRSFGEAIGLAFQHIDDALDEEHEKLASKARKRASDLLDECELIAKGFEPRGAGLLALTQVIKERMSKV